MINIVKSLLSPFSCQRYTELASRKMDQSLSAYDLLSYYLHHVICTFCRRSNRQLKLIEKAALIISATDQQISAQSCNQNLSIEAKTRIKNVINSNRQH